MFQSAIKINQFQCWSVFGKIPRLQPYFLAKNRSFSSLFNLQSKSINFNFGHISVNYQGYSLIFGQKSHIFITFQSAIKVNQFQFWSFFGKLPRLQPYFLAKNRTFSSLFNLQSTSINFNVGHLSAQYQGYSLTFWPKIAHFFIMFQSAIKINQFECWSFFGKIPRLQPYFLAKNRSFSSLFNLQSKSINFNFGHISVNYQGYSLIFGQKSHIFVTFQSAIKINQFQFWSFFGTLPRLQPYVLAKNRSFSSLFNLQSKSINVKFGQLSAKYQGYSLMFWPKIAHLFIMFQSAIKINQFQCWSFVSKLPRLQP